MTDSQQNGQVEASGGGQTCVGRCGEEGHRTSSSSLPYTLEPGRGETLASLGVGPVTSRPVEGGNPGSACRGHAGPEEHCKHRPTQGQKTEGGVKRARLNKTLVCMYLANGIFS